MKIVLLCLLLVSPRALMAQDQPAAAARPAPVMHRDSPDTYRFVYDLKNKGSLESGVSLAWNASSLLYRGANAAADATGVHGHWYSRPLFLPFLSLALPTPKQFLHEYYGHGAALREFGYNDISYRWGWFNTSSKSGYAASKRIQTQGTYEEKQLWIGGGLAASQLYLLEAEKDMYRRGRTTLLMAQPLMGAMSDISYLKDGLDADGLNRSNDGSSWLGNFKAQHGNSQFLTVEIADEARKAVGRSRMDPLLPWIAVTWLHYLWTGDDSMAAPMLPAAGLKFGFSPKFNLTPLGPENYYYAFIARDGRLAALYYRTGTSPEGDLKGWGAEFGPVNLAGFALTPGYDQWTLPDAKGAGLKYSGRGHNAQLKLDAPLWGALGLTGKAAYKTGGYMLGLPVHAGFYGYAGASLRF